MNLQASTILGWSAVAAWGQAIYNNVQLGFYPRLSTLILLIYALVLTSDWIAEDFVRVLHEDDRQDRQRTFPQPERRGKVRCRS